MKCVAVVGLGNISLRHRKNLKLIFPEVRVVAISASGRRPEGKVESADIVVGSIGDLIKQNPEFVIVASPATLHAMHAESLIKVGIPVLIEKPVTANFTDAKELLTLAKESKTPIAVGYCLRYLPSSKKVKELIEQRVLGSLYNVTISVGQYLPDWRPDKDYSKSVSARPELGGGALLELSHDLDYLQWLIGDVSIQYAQLRNSSELDLEVEELADMVFVSESGTLCNVHLDFIQKLPQRFCSFIGSKGRLDWDLVKNTVTFYDTNGTHVLYADEQWDKNKMYIKMLDDFISLIQGKKNACISLKEASTTIALIDEIKSKAILGKSL